MKTPGAGDAAGPSRVLHIGLLERDAEIAALGDAMSSARADRGATVLVEGGGGTGKSELLHAAAQLARSEGLWTLEGRGRELEQPFAYGVVTQLFEPDALPPNADAPPAPDPGDAFAVSHHLFTLTRSLTRESAGGRVRRPLAVIVDDLQWVDRPSLLFLAYLAARLGTLPITVVLALDAGASAADSRALAAVREVAAERTLRPGGLSPASVAILAGRELPGAGPPAADALVEVGRGNPFLTVQLAREARRCGLEPAALTATALGELLPEPVVTRVNARLSALPPEAASLARATAVLGDGASLRAAAAVAEVDFAAAAGLADALAAAHLLRPGPSLTFPHPVIARSVMAGASPLETGRMHRQAAEVLRAGGRSAAEVSPHLVAAPPAEDPWVVAVLRAAARETLATGRTALAEQMLERAAVEVSDPRLRDEVLAELREAEGAAGTSGDAGPPASAADTRAATGRSERAAGLDPVDRRALAHLAIRGSMAGEPRRRVVELAERAWGDAARPGSEAGDRRLAARLGTALVLVDALEGALEIAPPPVPVATPQGQARPDPWAEGGCCRTWALYHQGRLTEAMAQARLSESGAAATGHGPAAALAACHLQMGRFEEADATLSILETPEGAAELELPALFAVRAQLRLAQMRPAEALGDALHAERVARSVAGIAHPGVLPWRSTAALAHLAVSEPAEARRLAEEELELARAGGIVRAEIRALRVLGLMDRGKAGLARLREATVVGEHHPPRLEHLLALTDLGAALRRANQRLEARKPLRRALELSSRGGAAAIAERARQELTAAGARPGRTLLSGVDALTPSERRVADLAAEGRTTRQIASTLFVTPKTVEYHLRHVYRKLDVPSSRAELRKALAQPGPPVT